MQKILQTVFFTLLSTNLLLSQNVQIGLHNGYGVSQLSNYRSSSQDYWGAGRVVSWTAGLYVSTRLTPQWTVGTEYNINKKGSVRYGFEIYYTYHSFAPFVRFNILKNATKRMQPYIRAGGYLARKFKQEDQWVQSSGGYTIYLFEYSEADRFDAGVGAGAGVDIRLSPRFVLGFEARAERGLTSIFDTYATKISIDEWPKIYNVAAWGNLRLAVNLP